ncbi:MAG TPA: hypothetical protein VGM20_04350 [Gemmatimonadales bacterium]
MADRNISQQRLKAECELFERSLRSKGSLPPEVASFAPGGANNPERGASGWFVYLRRLIAVHAVGSVGGSGGSAVDPQKTAADAAAIETLSEAPLVRLSRVQDGSGQPKYLTVYRKSFVTLAHLHGRDLAIARLQPTVQTLFERPDFAPKVMRRIIDAIAEQHVICAWIATFPGVGMPFEPEQPPPEIPEAIKALQPLELHQILAMNLEVNYKGIMLARPLITPDPNPSGEQLYWSPFFAKAAELLGQTSRVLMRDWALESVLLRMQLYASDQRDQAARAEAEGGAA